MESKLLTLKDFNNKVLIQYIYDVKFGEQCDCCFHRKHTSKKIGVVVAVGPGIIGWSLCHKDDVFNKDIALHIALTRANELSALSYEDRFEILNNIPKKALNILDNMLMRSFAYYKSDDKL